MKIKNICCLFLILFTSQNVYSNELCTAMQFTTVSFAGLSAVSLLTGYLTSKYCIKLYPSEVTNDAENSQLLAQHAQVGKFYRPIRYSLTCGLISLALAMAGSLICLGAC